jgi:hypothetical protein
VDQLGTLTRQVAHCTLFWRIDIPGSQDSKPEQMGQVSGVMFVTAVLQATVLIQRGGIGKLYLESSVLQAIYQPVPVECRFHDHSPQVTSVARQQRHDLFKVVGHSLLAQDAIIFINDDHDAVVRVQINPAILVHASLPVR